MNNGGFDPAPRRRPGAQPHAAGSGPGAGLSRAAELVVMGCYGHTRSREILLDGATRTVLADMALPVFMAH